ncbi:chromate transporter [Rhizobium leguminosarum]|nr:chromate transporter [Rhizobium leguminosarum]
MSFGGPAGGRGDLRGRLRRPRLVAQQAIDTYGWLKPGKMLDGLGMAETTPGLLIMVSQFVGFMGAYRASGLDPLLAGKRNGSRPSSRLITRPALSLSGSFGLKRDLRVIHCKDPEVAHSSRSEMKGLRQACNLDLLEIAGSCGTGSAYLGSE